MKYKMHDVVMAIDKGKLYEAKVVKSQNIGSTWKYFIHFQGWARKFDVWIDEQQIALKSDVKSVEKLKDYASGIVTTTKSTKQKRGSKVAETTDSIIENISDDIQEVETRSSYEIKEVLVKRKSDNTDQAAVDAVVKKQRKQLLLTDLVDNEDEEYYRKINIPLNLKKHLVDEWGLITSDPKRLLQLPRSITVENVIEDFLMDRATKLEKNKEEVAKFRELFECLQSYFDKALPSILLYRHEREQFDALTAASSSSVEGDAALSTPPSKIYGAEHLLRFFVRLPRLLSNVFLAASEINQIIAKLMEFLKFLGKNLNKYIDIGGYVLVEEAMSYIVEWKENATKEQLAVENTLKTRHLANRRK